MLASVAPSSTNRRKLICALSKLTSECAGSRAQFRPGFGDARSRDTELGNQPRQTKKQDGELSEALGTMKALTRMAMMAAMKSLLTMPATFCIAYDLLDPSSAKCRR
jgi:hypothetical protein